MAPGETVSLETNLSSRTIEVKDAQYSKETSPFYEHVDNGSRRKTEKAARTANKEHIFSGYRKFFSP
jgi:hypothetical protein